MGREPRRSPVSSHLTPSTALRRRLRAAAINGALVALVIVILRSMDLLGLDEAMLRHTTQTVSRILSGFYPPPLPASTADQPPPDGPAGVPARDYAWNRITVVEIDDAYLEAQGRALVATEKSARAGWPLRLSQVAEILNVILDSNPRAVFLDFVLSQVRPGIDTVESHAGANDQGVKLLRAALDRASRDGVAVVLADFPLSRAEPRGCEEPSRDSTLPKRVFFSVHPELACAAAAIAAVRWTAEDDAYPLTVQTGAFSMRSPAAEIFALLRTPAATPAKTGDVNASDTLVTPAKHASESHIEEMLVTWGAGGFARSDDCHFSIHPRWTSVQWWAQLWRIGKDTLLPDGEGIGPEHQFCLFSNRISAASLLSEAHRATRDMNLARRVVMVGPAWATVPDTVVSPVLGRIPGVYLHAMALDNLISFAGRPYPFETVPDAPVKVDAILFGLIIGFGVGVGRFVHSLRPPHAGWAGQLRALGSEWIVSVAAVVPIAAILAAVGSVSPVLWLGAPLTLAVIEPILLAATGHMVPDASGGQGGES